MERLGIAIRDRVGLYTAAALILRRPDLSFTVLYDPETSPEAFVEKNRARFRSMSVNRCLCLSEDASIRDDFAILVEKAEGSLSVGLKHSDINTEFLYRTLQDGLFHHSYVLDMIDAYRDRLPEGRRLAVLSLLGYSYRRDDFVRAFQSKQVAVIDPIDAWLAPIPKREEKGKMRYYWTRRDFSLERLFSELLGEAVRFRTYYAHPWLRGEGYKADLRLK